MKEHRARGSWHPLAGGLTLGLLLFVVGCGSGGATVTGTVTIDKKPVTQGEVIFHSADGKKTARASIQPNGTYTAEGVPLGEVKITVATPPVPKMPTVAAKDYAKFKGKMPEGVGIPGVSGAGGPSVPERYNDPKMSGLSMTVASGKQTKDLPLTK